VVECLSLSNDQHVELPVAALSQNVVVVFPRLSDDQQTELPVPVLSQYVVPASAFAAFNIDNAATTPTIIICFI
jgi:hypothetical protein